MIGTAKDWLEFLKRLNRAPWKAFAMQFPVGVPAQDPCAEVPLTLPDEPLIVTRTRQVPGTR
jgi:hypothetical protein